MELIRNKDAGTFTIRHDGASIDVPFSAMTDLVNQYMKSGLRDTVEYLVNEADGDTIDTKKAPFSRDGFISEICENVESEIDDTGRFPSDEWIEEQIIDLADFYDMECEEE